MNTDHGLTRKNTNHGLTRKNTEEHEPRTNTEEHRQTPSHEIARKLTQYRSNASRMVQPDAAGGVGHRHLQCGDHR